MHSIKIRIPVNTDNESLYNSIESALNQNNFKVERKDDRLTFERLTSKRGVKFQILPELLAGFSEGSIALDKDHPEVLICKMSYVKQLIVSLVLGIIVNLIFSLYSGNYGMLFLRLGLPIVLIFFMFGALSGNAQVEEILRKTIKQQEG